MPVEQLDAYGASMMDEVQFSALVHSEVDWWHSAAGGPSFMVPKVGFPAWVAECIYLKYMHGVPEMSRVVLWYC